MSTVDFAVNPVENRRGYKRKETENEVTFCDSENNIKKMKENSSTSYSDSDYELAKKLQEEEYSSVKPSKTRDDVICLVRQASELFKRSLPGTWEHMKIVCHICRDMIPLFRENIESKQRPFNIRYVNELEFLEEAQRQIKELGIDDWVLENGKERNVNFFVANSVCDRAKNLIERYRSEKRLFHVYRRMESDSRWTYDIGLIEKVTVSILERAYSIWRKKGDEEREGGLSTENVIRRYDEVFCRFMEEHEIPKHLCEKSGVLQRLLKIKPDVGVTLSVAELLQQKNYKNENENKNKNKKNGLILDVQEEVGEGEKSGVDKLREIFEREPLYVIEKILREDNTALYYAKHVEIERLGMRMLEYVMRLGRRRLGDLIVDRIGELFLEMECKWNHLPEMKTPREVDQFNEKFLLYVRKEYFPHMDKTCLTFVGDVIRSGDVDRLKKLITENKFDVNFPCEFSFDPPPVKYTGFGVCTKPKREFLADEAVLSAKTELKNMLMLCTEMIRESDSGTRLFDKKIGQECVFFDKRKPSGNNGTKRYISYSVFEKNEGSVKLKNSCNRRTPLHLACILGNAAIVGALLDSSPNVDINASDVFDMRAYDYARARGRHDISSMIEEYAATYRIRFNSRKKRLPKLPVYLFSCHGSMIIRVWQ